MSEVLTTDVCVVGGGPAGAVCALRLARLGHGVLLVERAPRGRSHVGESLPAGVLPLLDELGLREAVERAGFLRPRGALVQWEGALHEHEGDGGEPGFQVDRGRFDALLLDAAQAAGVQVLQPVAADPAQPHGDEVHVQLRDGRVVHARWVVKAHGRRAAPADGRPRTAAMYAYWEGVPLGDVRPRVEASADAWYWGAPLPDGSFNAMVFVDAQQCAGWSGDEREQHYRRLLAQSALLAPCLQGRARERVQVCDATPRIDPTPVEGRIVKIGDAAFTIDPMSSQGVLAALRSGWQAAACVHTMARRPSSRALAAAFHQEQVLRTAVRHQRLAAGFHAAAAQRFGSAFWQRRARGAAPARGVRTLALPPLQASVALHPAARLMPVPALQGDFVVSMPALVHPALEGPVSQFGGWPAARALAPLQAGPVTVGGLLRAWQAQVGEAAAVQALTLLWRQGVVVPASSAAEPLA